MAPEGNFLARCLRHFLCEDGTIRDGEPVFSAGAPHSRFFCKQISRFLAHHISCAARRFALFSAVVFRLMCRKGPINIFLRKMERCEAPLLTVGGRTPHFTSVVGNKSAEENARRYWTQALKARVRRPGKSVCRQKKIEIRLWRWPKAWSVVCEQAS